MKRAGMGREVGYLAKRAFADDFEELESVDCESFVLRLVREYQFANPSRSTTEGRTLVGRNATCSLNSPTPFVALLPYQLLPSLPSFARTCTTYPSSSSDRNQAASSR